MVKLYSLEIGCTIGYRHLVSACEAHELGSVSSLYFRRRPATRKQPQHIVASDSSSPLCRILIITRWSIAGCGDVATLRCQPAQGSPQTSDSFRRRAAALERTYTLSRRWLAVRDPYSIAECACDLKWICQHAGGSCHVFEPAPSPTNRIRDNNSVRIFRRLGRGSCLRQG